MKRLELRGAVAVVTGAASGIGRATALALAARGTHLALVDRDDAGLSETAALAGREVRVTRHLLDVADRKAVAGLPDAVLTEHGRVTVLVNVAGVGLIGRFEDVTVEEYRWLIEINFLAVVGLTHAFLPVLRREPQAQIANMSSALGLVAPPNETAYAASKFAVRGFSESLQKELSGTTVGVTVLHPGGTRTGIATSARIAASLDQVKTRAHVARFTKRVHTRPPDMVGLAIARAIELRKRRVLIGSDAHIMALFQRLAPVRHWTLIQAFKAVFS